MPGRGQNLPHYTVSFNLVVTIPTLPQQRLRELLGVAHSWFLLGPALKLPCCQPLCQGQGLPVHFSCWLSGFLDLGSLASSSCPLQRCRMTRYYHSPVKERELADLSLTCPGNRPLSAPQAEAPVLGTPSLSPQSRQVPGVCTAAGKRPARAPGQAADQASSVMSKIEGQNLATFIILGDSTVLMKRGDLGAGGVTDKGVWKAAADG